MSEMSSDDGYILRDTAEGKFILQWYQGDEPPPVENARRDQKFDSLEEALRKYDSVLDRTEYGLYVNLKHRRPKDKS